MPRLQTGSLDCGCARTENLPADLPVIVILSGLPPKWDTLLRIWNHCKMNYGVASGERSAQPIERILAGHVNLGWPTMSHRDSASAANSADERKPK